MTALNAGHKVSGFPTLSELFPERVVSKAGEWLGLLGTDGLGFARRAHQQAERPGRPAPQASLDDFVAYLPQHNFIFIPTRDLWPAASVNARLPWIEANGKKIAPAAWLDANQHVEQMTWCPGLPMIIQDRIVADGGWIKRAGCSVFNLYRPPAVPRHSGVVDKWLDHVRLLLGEQAGHVINWLAHRVQRPDEKVNHALVIGGAPGIGKDTLLEPVKLAVGPWNFTEVSPQQLLGRFNGFLKSVVLRISEARDLGDQDRFALYDHLKVYLASPPDVLRIDEKHLRETSVFNVVGVIITTNYKTDGIFLPADDRRHFVAWSELTREDLEPDYWSGLYGWYAGGGLDHVAHYLGGLDISDFDPKAPPPKTPAFWEIVGASRAPEDDEMADALEALGRPPATTLSAIALRATPPFAEWLRDRKNARRVPHRLEACSYVAVRNDASTDGRWKVNGQNVVIYARSDLSLPERMRAAYRLSGVQ